MTTKIKSGVIGDNVVGITQLNVSDGTNGQVLITDGAGTLSFSTISGYTDSDVETYLNTSEIYTDATNNRLGIGTNSPVFGLDVRDVIYTAVPATTLNLRFGDTTNGTQSAISANNNSLIFYPNAATESMRIDSSGNVGIGTTSPDAPLHVQGTNSGVLVDTSTAYTPVIKASGVLSDLKLSSIGNGGNLVLDAPGTTSIIQMSVNGSERMRISSGGNVGIGTTSPQQPLVVSNAGGIGFEFVPASGIIQSYNRSGGAYSNFRIDANAFFVHTGSSATERMRITDAGKMFLGTTSNSRGGHVINGSAGDILKLEGGASGYLGLYITQNTALNHIYCDNTGTAQFYVTTNTGDYYFKGGSLSDRDLKENITSVPDGSLALINALTPKTYNFLASEGFGTEIKTGFIAQEVAEVITEGRVVTGTDGQKDMAVDTTGIVAHLVKAMQEQQTIIDALTARIETLEG
jgi:hypothetical protein